MAFMFYKQNSKLKSSDLCFYILKIHMLCYTSQSLFVSPLFSVLQKTSAFTFSFSCSRRYE